MFWRWSIRWSDPHSTPCPAPVELFARTTEQGRENEPPEIAELWRPGTGYAVCIDFLNPDKPPRRWSTEAKGRNRQKRMRERIEKAAPLFAEELIERALTQRPDYYAGQNMQ